MCSVCNGGLALQFRSFILAKYVTCVGHLYAYTEMIYVLGTAWSQNIFMWKAKSADGIVEDKDR